MTGKTFVSERLELLRPLLNEYTRRFSVLDFGSGIEYGQNIGQQIAAEYDSFVVSVEKDYSPDKFTPNKRTIMLTREFDGELLASWGECVQFDVVLGFNILHWFTNSLTMTYWLGRMGHHIFIQVPNPEESTAPNAADLPSLIDYIERTEEGGPFNYIASTSQFPAHPPRPLYYRQNPTPLRLTRTCLAAHPDSMRAELNLTRQSALINHKDKLREYRLGINLRSALMLKMSYPSREQVVDKLEKFQLPEEQHGDITMHNFIFDGEDLVLVDGGDSWGRGDEENLKKVIEEVQAWSD